MTEPGFITDLRKLYQPTRDDSFDELVQRLADKHQADKER